jgi:hypothetical protein
MVEHCYRRERAAYIAITVDKVAEKLAKERMDKARQRGLAP